MKSTKFIYISLFSFAMTLVLYFLSNNAGFQRSPSSTSQKSLADINYRRSYITLGENIPYKGLTHKPGEDGRYIKRLFGKLLQKGDELARDDWYNEELGVYKTYNTFLLTSILVPMHESSLMHFTNRSPHYCYFSNDLLSPKYEKDNALNFYPQKISELENQLATAENKSQISRSLRTYRVKLSNAKYLMENIQKFYVAYGRGENLFKHCEDFQEKDSIQQILFANDYADIGVLMFNAASHGDFFQSGGIFDVDQVIDYGLSYLYENGFNEIANNSKNYSCLSGVEQTSPREYALRLVRGAWAGRYNSGNVSQTCRFTKPNHRFRQNDVVFLRNLNKVIDENSPASLYHQYLPEGSIERKAFFELLDNVLNQKNNHEFIDQVLVTKYYESEELVTENESEEEEVEETQIEALAETLINEEQNLQELNPIEQEVLSESPQENSIEETNGDEITASNGDQDVSPPQTEQPESDQNTEEVAAINDEEEVVESQELDDIEITENTEESVLTEESISKDEVLPPLDNEGELPKFTKKDFNHVIDGSHVNIRFEPVVNPETYCGNTKFSSIKPIKIIKLEETQNGFVKIHSKGLEETIKVESCLEKTELYVHKDYVKKIQKFDGRMAELKKWVATRDRPGMSKSVEIGILGPGKIIITDEKVYGNEYYWYETILEDGKKYWFYAGTISNLKVEFIK